MTSVLESFRRDCGRNGGATALIDDRGRSLTRAQLAQEADRVAERLTGMRVGRDEAVLICMPNRTDWMAAYLGTLVHGAVPGTVPVTHDAQAIAASMRQIGARTLILSSHHRKRDFAAELPDLLAALDTELRVLLFGEDPGELTEVIFNGSGAPSVQLPGGTAHVLFSSSTTGKPKAIAHSEESLSAYNSGIIQRYEVRGETTIFMPSPLGHSTGVWHGARMSLLTGSTLIIQDQWDPVRALRLVEERRAGITVAATPFLKDLIECPWEGPARLRHLKTFLCGGAQVPPELLARAADELPETFVGSVWAMSEGGATCSIPSDPPEKVTMTCGVPLPGVELRTLDENGGTTPPGVPGELVMRTPSQCLGYVQQQDVFASSFTADGFFCTGDQAVIDHDGYMTITGRIKDMLIRGGVNIAPVPIENVLLTHPAVRQVAVVGKPDARLGERICAVVVTHPGEELDHAGLASWLASTDLPKRWWPEEIVTVANLPMTPAGKVQKRVLVEALWP